MADDDRRAEIEAVAEAISKADPAWIAAEPYKAATAIMEVLDRVRDARGDDTPVWVSPLAEAEHDEAARSPDEDHEGRRRKKPLRVATEDQPAALAMWDAWDRYHRAVLAARSPQGMADDDRRAEIEAATDALLADSGLPRYGGHRSTIERRMAIAFNAADRVRDARGDDEAVCSRCQGTGKDPCGFGSPDPWVCMTCGGSRSPQGEGHEAVPLMLGRTLLEQSEEHEAARRAAHEAAQDWVDAAGGDEVDTGHVVDEALNAYLARVSPSRDGSVAEGHDADDGTSWRCTDCNCINREDEAFCFRCGAGQPEFPARLRDGSVAVEDVLAVLRRIGEMAGAKANGVDARAMGLLARKALAEFSPASTGDREDGRDG